MSKSNISATAQVSESAIIGRNVKIGRFSIINGNVVLGDNVTIGDLCVIGEPVTRDLHDRTLRIGADSTIRSHAVLYEGSSFGPGLQTGHHTMIREETVAGERLSVGSFCDIEGDCRIGDFVRCHSYVHVGRGSKIGDFVWLYSLVTLTNDPLPPSLLEAPVVLEDGVVVCVGSTVLPGVIMRKGAFAAAGTQVRGEVLMGRIVSGSDGQEHGHVASLFHMESETRHPWMRHLKSRYPERVHPRIAALEKEILASRFG
jgi:acyl-[acyl carrier protein]--UDP-N-acetylglucosamine O-acyltransferase